MTKRVVDHATIVKFYPSSWRDRYGDELTMFLNDRYGDGPVPIAARLSMMGTGSLERLRSVGIIGKSVDWDKRVRGKSLLVLGAWVLFVIAGVGLSRHTAHWTSVVPSQAPGPSLVVPQGPSLVGMGAVGAAAGLFILVIAALVSLPAFVRMVRSDGRMRRWTTVRAVGITLAAAIACIAIVVLIRGGGPAQGNFAIQQWRPLAAFVVMLVVGAFAIVAAATMVLFVTRLETSRRVTKVLGLLALAMTALLTVIFVGSVILWTSSAIPSQWSFASFLPQSPALPGHIAMVIVAMMMFSGLVLALFGATGIVSALRAQDSEPEMIHSR
jgi:hypothetical protein